MDKLYVLDYTMMATLYVFGALAVCALTGAAIVICLAIFGDRS